MFNFKHKKTKKVISENCLKKIPIKHTSAFTQTQDKVTHSYSGPEISMNDNDDFLDDVLIPLVIAEIASSIDNSPCIDSSYDNPSVDNSSNDFGGGDGGGSGAGDSW